MEKSDTELDPWALYIYAMKAPVTRAKYTAKFAKFLDSIDQGKLNGAQTVLLEERARAFASKAAVDFNWAFARVEICTTSKGAS